MVRIDHEVVRRRRLELAWTPEKLAEESGLDARTIRRIEQGRSLTRLRSAVAIAQALKVEVVTLVADNRSERILPESNDGGLGAALAAAEKTVRKELVSPGEWGFKETLYVLSMLFTRSFVLEGKDLRDSDKVDRMVAAFKAADGAIQIAMSTGGDWGAEEATYILSLLLTRYGTAFSGRSANGVEAGADFVQAVCDQAKRALPHYVDSE